jgi:hypothetical protein
MMVGVPLISLPAAPIPAQANGSENGSGKVTAPNTFFVAGNEFKSGQYDVNWKSSSSDAAVILRSAGKTPVRVPGGIVKVENKCENDTALTEKDSSGRHVLKSLQFRGKRIKIVFE